MISIILREKIGVPGDKASATGGATVSISPFYFRKIKEIMRNPNIVVELTYPAFRRPKQVTLRLGTKGKTGFLRVKDELRSAFIPGRGWARLMRARSVGLA